MLGQNRYRICRSTFSISIPKDTWGRFVWEVGLEAKVLGLNFHQIPSGALQRLSRLPFPPPQNWESSPSNSPLPECCKHKYLMFQSIQKICLRRLLARCSAINLYNLFTSLQPVFSPCNKGSHPRLSELILIRPCEALNQYSVYCLTYLLKNILH